MAKYSELFFNKETLKQKIKQTPENASLYLSYAYALLKSGNSIAIKPSLKLLSGLPYDKRHLDNFLKQLTFDEPALRQFLEPLSVIAYCATNSAEVESLKKIIEITVNSLEHNSSRLTYSLGYLGYFKNIQGDYVVGQKYLEACISRYGNNLFLARSLSESLLGSWNLSRHKFSGVDFSMMQNFEDFLYNTTLSRHSLDKQVLSSAEVQPTIIVFLSCDATYLKEMGIAQAVSVFETSPTAGFHFHIMNPDKESRSLVDKVATVFTNRYLSISCEAVEYGQPGSWERKTYYASARFCRAASFLLDSPVPIAITDADILFKRDVGNLLRKHQLNFDISLIAPSESLPLAPLYASFCASLVIVNKSNLGQIYLDLVSRFIQVNLKRYACWTLDQLALLSVYKALQNNKFAIILRKLRLEEYLDDTGGTENQNALLLTSAGKDKFGSNRYTDLVKSKLRTIGF